MLPKQTTAEVSVILNRSIFFFYSKALRYVPVSLMLCHWYGVYSFHDNPREILIDVRENEECSLFYGLHLPRCLHAPCKPLLQIMLAVAHTVRLLHWHKCNTAILRLLSHNQRNVRCRLHPYPHDLGSVCLCLRTGDMPHLPTQQNV